MAELSISTTHPTRNMPRCNGTNSDEIKHHESIKNQSCVGKYESTGCQSDNSFRGRPEEEAPMSNRRSVRQPSSYQYPSPLQPQSRSQGLSSRFDHPKQALHFQRTHRPPSLPSKQTKIANRDTLLFLPTEEEAIKVLRENADNQNRPKKDCESLSRKRDRTIESDASSGVCSNDGRSKPARRLESQAPPENSTAVAPDDSRKHQKCLKDNIGNCSQQTEEESARILATLPLIHKTRESDKGSSDEDDNSKSSFGCKDASGCAVSSTTASNSPREKTDLVRETSHSNRWSSCGGQQQVMQPAMPQRHSDCPPPSHPSRYETAVAVTVPSRRRLEHRDPGYRSNNRIYQSHHLDSERHCSMVERHVRQDSYAEAHPDYPTKCHQSEEGTRSDERVDSYPCCNHRGCTNCGRNDTQSSCPSFTRAPQRHHLDKVSNIWEKSPPIYPGSPRYLDENNHLQSRSSNIKNSRDMNTNHKIQGTMTPKPLYDVDCTYDNMQITPQQINGSPLNSTSATNGCSTSSNLRDFRMSPDTLREFMGHTLSSSPQNSINQRASLSPQTSWSRSPTCTKVTNTHSTLPVPFHGEHAGRPDSQVDERRNFLHHHDPSYASPRCNFKPQTASHEMKRVVNNGSTRHTGMPYGSHIEARNSKPTSCNTTTSPIYCAETKFRGRENECHRRNCNHRDRCNCQRAHQFYSPQDECASNIHSSTVSFTSSSCSPGDSGVNTSSPVNDLHYNSHSVCDRQQQKLLYHSPRSEEYHRCYSTQRKEKVCVPGGLRGNYTSHNSNVGYHDNRDNHEFRDNRDNHEFRIQQRRNCSSSYNAASSQGRSSRCYSQPIDNVYSSQHPPQEFISSSLHRQSYSSQHTYNQQPQQQHREHHVNQDHRDYCSNPRELQNASSLPLQSNLPPPLPVNDVQQIPTKLPDRKREQVKVLPAKFSWKKYPELEQFLLVNRDQYLQHSALNYTFEQKRYNNELTQRLLKLASDCGYYFDRKIFSFVAVRDRIRCYYKSYVQSMKKKGIIIGYAATKKHTATTKKKKKSNVSSKNVSEKTVDSGAQSESAKNVFDGNGDSATRSLPEIGYDTGHQMIRPVSPTP